MLRVVSDRANVVVAHWKIDAAISIRVSHRTARSQIIPDGVRIMAPVWVVVIEVSCPIDDRRALPHGCLLHGHGADRLGMLALDCQGPIRLQASIRARMEAMRLGTRRLAISRPPIRASETRTTRGFAALSATSCFMPRSPQSSPQPLFRGWTGFSVTPEIILHGPPPWSSG